MPAGRRQRVRRFASRFRYNRHWGGPAPVLALHPAFGPNKSPTTAWDQSPYRHHGTWSGSTTDRSVVTTRGRAWRVALANSDYLQCASPIVSGPPWAIAAWVRWDGSKTTSVEGTVFANGSGSPTSRTAVSVSIEDDRPHHLVVCSDGAVYQDGQYVGSAGAFSADSFVTYRYQPSNGKINCLEWDTGENARIGRATHANDYWDGLLWSVLVWTNVLPPALISDLYRSSLDGAPSSLWRRIVGRPVFGAAAGGFGGRVTVIGGGVKGG